MKKFLSLIFTLSLLSLVAAEKTPAELVAEKQKELAANVERLTAADIAPAQKLTADRLAAFQNELTERMGENAKTLLNRQIVPNNNKMRDFQRKIDDEINEKISKYKKVMGITKSQTNDMKKELLSVKQKDIEKYQKKLDTETADLIARFKKTMEEKNQAKLDDYAKKLEAVTAAGAKLFSDYHSAVAVNELVKYQAELEGKPAPEAKPLKKPEFTPAFPAAVDPDKKFIYQNFR